MATPNFKWLDEIADVLKELKQISERKEKMSISEMRAMLPKDRAHEYDIFIPKGHSESKKYECQYCGSVRKDNVKCSSCGSSLFFLRRDNG